MKPKKTSYYIHISITIISIALNASISAQSNFIDHKTKNIFDSLDKRIAWLNSEMPKISANRDANYFATTRDLEMTIFLRQYHQLVFDEKLLEAEDLVEQKIKSSEKRSDKYAIDFYNGYKTKLTRLRGEKRTYYQQLFTKEKNFRQEFEKYTKVGDEYSLNRAIRMVSLAIDYAKDQNLTETLKYLFKYKNYATAMLYDLHSNYDLKKLSNNENYFRKVIVPMLESDSLGTIMEAGDLILQCYNFSLAANSRLDTNYFTMQQIVAANAIADWNERQGIKTELASLTGQSIVARFDSLNREGIYQWHDMVLVISTVSFSSNSENVRRGEAIIDADKTVLNYVRLNKIYKSDSKHEKAGNSFFITYIMEGKNTNFAFDSKKQEHQYMICYRYIINQNVTDEMERFLPPLQFKEEINK